MLDVRFRPLEKWTEPRKLGGVNGQFRTSLMGSFDKLEIELKKLLAKDIYIEAGFKLTDIRNDGWPRGGVRPSHPGVILYFKKGDDPLRFASGTYKTWQQNIHAIALTLESLRAIDRYGATSGHEQYLGFKALPAPAWTIDAAAEWLAARTPWVSSAAELLLDHAAYRRAYRDAASALHPDKGGSSELFQALGEVARVLDEHHKTAVMKTTGAR